MAWRRQTPESNSQSAPRIRSAASADGGRIFRAHMIFEQRAFGRGVFAVGFDVDGEIAIGLRVVESVVLLQPVDFRFRNRRDLAFVGVKRGQALGDLALAADFAEGGDEFRGFRPGFGFVEFVRRDAERGREIFPELRMIRFARFFVDQVGEDLAAGRLVVAARVRRRRDRSGRPRRAGNTGRRNRPAFPCSTRPGSRRGKRDGSGDDGRRFVRRGDQDRRS